jgi:hypothetical protein
MTSSWIVIIFRFQLLNNLNMPETICDDCSETIQRLNKFAETSLRAENMFSEIMASYVSEEGDLRNMRLKYGFDEGLVSLDVKPVLKFEPEEDILVPEVEPKRKLRRNHSETEVLEESTRKKSSNSEKTRLNKLFFK